MGVTFSPLSPSLATTGVMSKGVRWKVGDGRSIKIWNEKWIPSLPNFMTSATGDVRGVVMVNDLIDAHTRQWNADLIANIFRIDEVDYIRAIPLSRTEAADARLEF